MSSPDAEQLALLDEQAGLAMLPDTGRVHREPTDTEAAAAQSINAKPLRDRALAILREHPAGLTDDEGAALLEHGADRLKFGRRRQELRIAGLVTDSGRRRPGRSGRLAIVWRAT